MICFHKNKIALSASGIPMKVCLKCGALFVRQRTLIEARERVKTHPFEINKDDSAETKKEDWENDERWRNANGL